jgi:glutamine amidotransferase
MKIGIVDYGMGNLTSLKNSIEFLGFDVSFVSTAKEINEFEILFLPGVGAFPAAMKNLNDQGVVAPIKKFVAQGKKLIGICLGMQLLFTESLEFGKTEGLGIVEGVVLPFQEKIDLRIPHMGWNELRTKQSSFEEFQQDYYFVHSYYCQPHNSEDVLFTTDYGIEFCSAVKLDDRVYGFQFHPEKSQKNGLKLLKQVLG